MAIYYNEKTKKYEYRVYVINEFGKKQQKEKTGFKSEAAAKKAENELVIKYKVLEEKRKEEKAKKQNMKVISFNTLYEDYDKYIHTIKIKKKLISSG